MPLCRGNKRSVLASRGRQKAVLLGNSGRALAEMGESNRLQRCCRFKSESESASPASPKQGQAKYVNSYYLQRAAVCRLKYVGPVEVGLAKIYTETGAAGVRSNI